MATKTTKNTEAKLLELGFKKKLLGDKSAYWFEKPITKLFRGKAIKGKKFKAYADPATKFEQYQIQYTENNAEINFLEFPKLKSMLKFIKKNGKL